MWKRVALLIVIVVLIGAAYGIGYCRGYDEGFLFGQLDVIQMMAWPAK